MLYVSKRVTRLLIGIGICMVTSCVCVLCQEFLSPSRKTASRLQTMTAKLDFYWLVKIIRGTGGTEMGKRGKSNGIFFLGVPPPSPFSTK